MTTTTPPSSGRPRPAGGRCGEFTLGMAAIIATLAMLARKAAR